MGVLESPGFFVSKRVGTLWQFHVTLPSLLDSSLVSVGVYFYRKGWVYFVEEKTRAQC